MAQIKVPPERAPDIIFPETANLFGLKVWIKEHVHVLFSSEEDYFACYDSAYEFKATLNRISSGVDSNYVNSGWTDVYNRYMFEKTFDKEVEEELR